MASRVTDGCPVESTVSDGWRATCSKGNSFVAGFCAMYPNEAERPNGETVVLCFLFQAWCRCRESRSPSFLRGVLIHLCGDCLCVSRASCAGSIADRRRGRKATKLNPSSGRARRLLAHPPAEHSPGSERHLVVSAAACQGAAMAPHARSNGRHRSLNRR